MTHAYLTDSKRRDKIKKIGNNPKEYLEQSINALSKLQSMRRLKTFNSSLGKQKVDNGTKQQKLANQKLDNLIKDRQAMLKYIIENPDYLKSSNA